MKKRSIALGVVALLIAGVGGFVLVSGESPLSLIKQSVAQVVVKINGADISPPKEFQASTSLRRDEAAKEELGYVIGTQAYLYGAASQRFEDFSYGVGQMTQLAAKFNPGRFNADANDGLYFNELGFVQRLPKPDLKLGVTPNLDTLYGTVILELSKSPLVLTVPVIEDRYFSVQVVDSNLSLARTGVAACPKACGIFRCPATKANWQSAYRSTGPRMSRQSTRFSSSSRL